MIIKKKKVLNATIENINNFKFIRIFNKQKQEKENYKKLNIVKINDGFFEVHFSSF